MKTYGRYPLVPVEAQGCRLWDADGKEYLDFLAGVAVNNLGHCHPKVVAAMQEQAAKLMHCSNYYHIPSQIELAELLCSTRFADRVFFCNSGAEANEAAIKLARKYSRENRGENASRSSPPLASFHGRTMARYQRHRPGEGPALLRPAGATASSMCPSATSRPWLRRSSPTTCAVMLEPIQGEGGVNVPLPGYFQAVRQLCDEHGLLLIFDEVQAGCGRTGKLFAYEHYGVSRTS